MTALLLPKIAKGRFAGLIGALFSSAGFSSNISLKNYNKLNLRDIGDIKFLLQNNKTEQKKHAP